MHKLNFFPLGNADCCRIDLENGKKILFDYANTRNPDDEDDLRIALDEKLREDLDEANRDSYDVVAFTHLDTDHIKGASDFFWLEHAKKYQSDDRIKIDELWVPAAVITEEGCTDDAAVVQAEACHRLREKKGIRVFSRPEALKDWLEEEGIDLGEVRDLFTDAGQVVPGFTTTADGVEFFAHSPFAKRQDENEVEDRNLDSLVVHATFTVQGRSTKLMLGSDVNHEVLSDIVQITKKKDRADRLQWDVFKLPHHCSYTVLGPEKGDDETEPTEDVAWLFEEQGRKRAIIVSTSDPIPSQDTEQPPHRQAANYYKRIAKEIDGEFKVTMEHPKKSDPEPLVIKIEGAGAAVEKMMVPASVAVLTQKAPRAG
jgi:hypothetical protein